jgi:hypothetical protein
MSELSWTEAWNRYGWAEIVDGENTYLSKPATEGGLDFAAVERLDDAYTTPHYRTARSFPAYIFLRSRNGDRPDVDPAEVNSFSELRGACEGLLQACLRSGAEGDR